MLGDKKNEEVKIVKKDILDGILVNVCSSILDVGGSGDGDEEERVDVVGGGKLGFGLR